MLILRILFYKAIHRYRVHDDHGCLLFETQDLKPFTIYFEGYVMPTVVEFPPRFDNDEHREKFLNQALVYLKTGEIGDLLNGPS